MLFILVRTVPVGTLRRTLRVLWPLNWSESLPAAFGSSPPYRTPSRLSFRNRYPLPHHHSIQRILQVMLLRALLILIVIYRPRINRDTFCIHDPYGRSSLCAEVIGNRCSLVVRYREWERSRLAFGVRRWALGKAVYQVDHLVKCPNGPGKIGGHLAGGSGGIGWWISPPLGRRRRRGFA